MGYFFSFHAPVPEKQCLWTHNAYNLMETFVFQELKRQASWSDTPVQFHHFLDLE
jgi:hypothetical protein